MSSVHVRRAIEADIREFRAWRYPAPYDVYDLGDERLEDGVAYFMQDDVACHVLIDDAGGVLGYCTFGTDGQVPGGDYTRQGLDIGLGIRPDLIGRGRGAAWIDAVCHFAMKRFAPDRLRVTIAAWNERARAAWESAGFRSVRRFARSGDSGDHTEFVILERSATPEVLPQPRP